jgi:hypothetical protein
MDVMVMSLQRSWTNSHNPDLEHFPPPEHLYEHFLVCGLPPDADVSAVSTSARAAHAAQRNGVNVVEKSKAPPHTGPSGPTYPADLLFVFPPGKPINVENITHFCFPHGVEPKLLERTPSMSDLNKVRVPLNSSPVPLNSSPVSLNPPPVPLTPPSVPLNPPSEPRIHPLCP